MTAEQRKKVFRYAAWPAALLVCGGMYFGARAIADAHFSAALESVSDTEVQTLEGLWHYNALSAREQRLYEVLRDAIDLRETETARVSFVPTQKEFTAAFDAVMCDHPLYCDLVPAGCVLVAADHSAEASLAYLPDGGMRREILEATVGMLTAAVSTTDEKTAARQLHDMLTASCAYPAQTEDAAVGETAYDALVVGEAGGMGYALAYALLCRAAEIPCAVVTGTAAANGISGEHAWNVLTLDGVSGFTDVMWDDTAAITDGGEDAAALAFHGYYFLSRDEMAADHTPVYDFGVRGDTDDYYEQGNLCADSPDALAGLLQTLLTDARRSTSDTVEFRLDPQLNLTGYALEEILSAAITAANADETITAPLLRVVNRVYHTSASGGGITVQLFYEETDLLGEPE
ncbi:MAG: hypothetical protein E7604_02995 [Ruminococcaceae bacterium]|nr:hypothetical protein [Oscillospiraceae bacterium]